MAIIKCPECGKEISDKSKQCIHCGYPLAEMKAETKKELICTINGVDYDFTEALDEVNDWYKQYINPSSDRIKSYIRDIGTRIARLTGISSTDATALASKIIINKEIPRTFYVSEPTNSKTDIIKCPRCGSTAIVTGARGVNWTLGLIGASKTVNRCAKCGHTWTPKKK